MSHFFKQINNIQTLFLDRDGVINKRLVDDYVKNWAEFEFLPGVTESLKILSGIFDRIIVVTNQQGVGKGRMTEKQLNTIHENMKTAVKRAGGRIDAVYYCTDLKDKPGNCRKPSIAMFNKAKTDFPEIDASKSIMVGDSQSDIDFGNNAGMFTVFIGNENKTANVCFSSLKSFADAVANR
jgi:D-glycero-D-manno-heptose 1,7-bisphosphate phosphatase